MLRQKYCEASCRTARTQEEVEDLESQASQEETDSLVCLASHDHLLQTAAVTCFGNLYSSTLLENLKKPRDCGCTEVEPMDRAPAKGDRADYLKRLCSNSGSYVAVLLTAFQICYIAWASLAVFWRT